MVKKKNTYFQQQNIRTLLLITSTVIYMMLGAAVFSALEYEKHITQKKQYKEIRKRLQLTYNMSEHDVEQLAQYLHKRRHIETALDPWSFAGSFYFTSVTITTIGYGHSVPQTISGQVFCILYATIGIPLNLTMFQAIGERMGVIMSCLLQRVKKFLGFKNHNISLIHLVLFGGGIWTAFLAAGAAMFAHYENWNFFESFFYFFVTLTTIGFGDMVALQEINKNTPSNYAAYNNKTLYIASTMIMIYLGLTIASSVINLLVMRLMELQQPKQKSRSISWKTAPLCVHCKHKGLINGTTDPNYRVIENQSVSILENFEEEFSFKSYKQLKQQNKL